MDHLDESVQVPGMLELKEGTHTLGRAAPADLVIGVPTVSAKHAEIKVGESSPSSTSSKAATLHQQCRARHHHHQPAVHQQRAGRVVQHVISLRTRLLGHPTNI